MKYVLICFMIFTSVLCNAQAERAKDELPLKSDPNGHRRVPIVVDRSKTNINTDIEEANNKSLNHKRKLHRRKKALKPS